MSDLEYLEKYLPKDRLEEGKQLLKKGVPVQYIVGEVDFYGALFEVNKDVLIPRFETEGLVEQVIHWIEMHPSIKPYRLIDLGCGSGIIGITLKKKVPNLEVTLLDISEEALDVAKRNRDRHQVDLAILKQDMVAIDLEPYDIIVSNPPYIGKDEKVEEIVQKNEPHLALYAKEEGTYYYHKILEKIGKSTKKPVLVAFEIGAHQKEVLFHLMEQYLDGYQFTCKQDLAGFDRIILLELEKKGN